MEKTTVFGLSRSRLPVFYERIGLKNGDVIQRINGVEVKDPQTFMQVFNQLKDESSITMDLMRNNQKESFSYEIR